ncbi:hypothetical protein NE857_30140 [Nocardiopsis exhalans]|uniref:Uncharacterized protein n=1 Tax=Nocardiopsis exhalans TaxID=163604 RepID=A0ABY5D506_9ACTN|nr:MULTISPECIES: hypothetical protein [Nocardiopsis]USY19456.1 hypothetical protein NE857_30140 [Nocardiopsis exhalans]
MTDAGADREQGPEEEPARARGRQRGGSPSAISGALKKDPQPGPQHWGGPRPRRAEPDVFFPRKFPRLSPRDL